MKWLWLAVVAVVVWWSTPGWALTCVCDSAGAPTSFADFTDTGNWTGCGGGAPGAGDTAQIDPGCYVELDSDLTMAELIVNDTLGQVNSGFRLKADASSADAVTLSLTGCNDSDAATATLRERRCESDAAR